MSDPRETRRKSKAALYQQGRVSPSLGANDPRTRRSAQARLTSELTGAYVRLDEQGRVTLDYDALRTQLQSDLNLSSDAAITAAQLAGAYLTVSQDGALDVDYDALRADILSGLVTVTDGDKGDITVSEGGARWSVDDRAITYAKVQDVTAARLLGNSNGASAPIEEIAIGAGLELKASQLYSLVVEQPELVRVLDADASLSASGAQPWFPTNGSATLAGSTAYLFRGTLFFDATAVAVSVLFAGTATIGSITYNFVGQRIASGSSNVTQSSGWQTGTALPTTAVAATNSTTGNGWITVEGIVRVSTTGTLTPQLSIASGGGTAYRNSWFGLWKLGANTITTKGTWS